jgi:hypothetical protein
MSKLDEMRRQREAQQRAREGQQPAADSAGLAPVIPLRPSVPSDAATEPATGKCSECGKQRTLERGVLPNHQKGLGKMCPGSRKPPA